MQSRECFFVSNLLFLFDFVVDLCITEISKNDATLRWLVRDYNQSYYNRDVVPFSLNLNFKVTKKLLRDRLNIAMFCNKLWDYTPDYKSGTILIRRHVNPYFGLELNIKL